MTSSKAVIAKVIADLGLNETEIPITDIKQWIGESLMNIGSVNQLDHKVEVIPGPSAVQSALALSGLPTSSYTFKGFAPRKNGQRKTFFSAEMDLPHTIIFFESKYRIVATLEAALEVLGDRRCAVCLEMTKKFEQIYRGFLSDVINELKSENIRGEITAVIAGNHLKFTRDTEQENE